MTNSKLKIGIKDGTPHIIENSDNVEIVIYDYDVNGVEDNHLEEDDFGNKCIIDVLQ